MRVVRVVAAPLAVVALAVATLAVPVASADPVPVACGDTLTGRGILTGDLNCFQPDYLPITIAGHGRIDLAGYALQASAMCEGSCAIANGFFGGSIAGLKSVDVRNVELGGEIDADKNIHLRNVAWAFGVGARAYYGRILVEDSSISGLSDVGVAANQNHVKIVRSSITDNRHIGVAGTRVLLKDSTVTGNGWGVECGHSLLDRICNGGPDAGLECGPSVECAGGSCVRGAICADILAFKVPVLRDSSCDTSAMGTNANQSWRVCAED